MSYILSHSAKETDRLTKQSTLSHFDINKELSGFSFEGFKYHLDVGCGDGRLCSHLKQLHPNMEVFGIDIDKARIETAKSLHSNINFIHGNILNEELPQCFDLITNRLVAHHFNLDGYKSLLSRMYESLKANGEIVIIDMDGAFLNLGTNNSKLLNDIQKLHESFPGDMQIARKIPSLLKEVGFKNIETKITLEHMHGTSKNQEAEQWRERFEIAKDFYLAFFGSESKTNAFFESYLTEFTKEEVPVFYNKFIISAFK